MVSTRMWRNPKQPKIELVHFTRHGTNGRGVTFLSYRTIDDFIQLIHRVGVSGLGCVQIQYLVR